MLASVGSRIANQVLLAAVDPGRAISPDSRLRMLGRGAAHASSSSGLGSALAELPLQETPQQLIMRKLYQVGRAVPTPLS